MIERRIAETPRGLRVVLADSISFIRAEDAGAVVVCASHGGESSGEYALGKRLGLVFFNDAGVGKDSAGIRALEILADEGFAAAAISSRSARIGDVADHWSNGVVSHANQHGGGIVPGMSVQEAVDAWAAVTGRL